MRDIAEVGERAALHKRIAAAGGTTAEFAARYCTARRKDRKAADAAAAGAATHASAAASAGVSR
ncbi:MAG TPA: hypothetical protein VFR90_15785 [Methylibium sp.]|uniref:hypothetical protein n=1 Tax=Methylibium sp. TaxID=2067992 RepID=UPI002DB6053C|nr:hypothetical protein [Methylibium sp.]HEU4460581.1 hypothetical protein [Methylibium sp.]